MSIQTSRTPSDTLTLAQAIDFVVRKKFLDINFLTIGTVEETDGTLLTVKSLINYKLADGTGFEPPEIFKVPYGIIRGGNSAIVIPYVKGDTVLIGFIDRAIDSLKSALKPYVPEINRIHSIMDAFVIMSWNNSNVPPTTYIRLDDNGGVSIITPKDINVNGNNVNVNASHVTVSSSDINLGGSNGGKVLTTNSVITAPNGGGQCTIASPSTTTKAV